MKTDLTLSDGSTFSALPCPHCSSSNLAIEVWSDDDGERDAVVCLNCLASAPVEVWNQRVTPPLPDSIQHALNSGNGTYKP